MKLRTDSLKGQKNGKPLVKLTKKIRKKPEINKRGEITINTTEMQKFIREYYETLYANKLDNLEVMDTFLIYYFPKLPKLNQEQIENLNRLISTKEIKTVKNIPLRASPDGLAVKVQHALLWQPGFSSRAQNHTTCLSVAILW